MKGILSRLLVAFICIPLLLLIYWNGTYCLITFLIVLNLIITYEIIKVFKMKGVLINKAVYVMNPVVLAANSLFGIEYAFGLIFLTIIYTGFCSITRNVIGKSLESVVYSVFVMIYTSLFLSFLYRIRELENGSYIVILLVLLVWLTDTMAYFTGVLFGKHKKIFIVSPKKSLEGFIGGFVFCCIGGFAFHKIFPGFIPLQTAIFAVVSAGLFGQFGDLFESLIKRTFEVKDTSNILFGHGGLLDRFDSILFSAPLFYFLLNIFG